MKVAGGMAVVTNNEGKDKPPMLKLVSDNPSRDVIQARQEAQRTLANLVTVHARQEAQRKLAILAATILRNMAGRESAPLIMQSVVDLIDAQKKLYALTGGWLSSEDEANALSLPRSELDPDASEVRYREWQHVRGMERIVQGAFRLAAHQVLGEDPHFGGKYSERLIEDGIAAIQTAFKPPPRTKALTKKEEVTSQETQTKWGDRLRVKAEPPVRRKRWSSRNSRSYRDMEPED
jgi:hypothetical protein